MERRRRRGERGRVNAHARQTDGQRESQKERRTERKEEEERRRGGGRREGAGGERQTETEAKTKQNNRQRLS